MATYRNFLLAAPLAACLFLVSCKSHPPERELSQKEYTDFCMQLEKAVMTGDEQAFLSRIYVDDFADSIVKGTGESSIPHKEVSTAITSSMTAIAKELSASVDDGGSYRFLHLIRDHNTVSALFRVHSKEGINYHQMYLSVHDGKPWISDIYIYLSGENISATLKNLFMLSFHSGNTDEEATGLIKKLGELKDLTTSGQSDQALEIYNSFPDNWKHSKSVQLYHVMICARIGGESYTQAIDEYSSIFPDDPSLDLVTLDGLFLKGDYKGTLKAVNNLDKHVKDPLLDLHRGNIYSRMDSTQKALDCLKRLVDQLPTETTDPYYSIALLDIGVAKNYEEACTYIRLMKKNFNITGGVIEPKLKNYLGPLYADFKRSAAYKSLGDI
jgi:tetratricopeptide (TPR) repeat protein